MQKFLLKENNCLLTWLFVPWSNFAFVFIHSNGFVGGGVIFCLFIYLFIFVWGGVFLIAKCL